MAQKIGTLLPVVVVFALLTKHVETVDTIGQVQDTLTEIHEIIADMKMMIKEDQWRLYQL